MSRGVGLRDCGNSSNLIYFGGKRKKASKPLANGKIIRPSLAKWDFPPRGANAERTSLELQCSKFVRVDRPDVTASREALQSHYPHTVIPAVFDKPYIRGETQFEKGSIGMGDVSQSISRKSSPGFPLCILFDTNGKLFDVRYDAVERAVVERLNLLKDFDTTQNLLGQELVVRGLCDPCKLFVKQEPHKLEKLQEGRVRLIASVSIIDNMIARLLFGPQNDTEIENWQDCPSKPGMGLHDEGLEQLDNEVRSKMNSSLLAEADISGWDFSMQSWDFDEDLERRAHLNGGHNSLWYKVAKSHFYCMQRKLFVLSDGTLLEQQQPGIMPSGWYLTSSTNSFVRNLNSYYVQYSWHEHDMWCIAMGDDSVEKYVPNAQEAYLALGKRCKMYNIIERDFEFCSTRFPLVGLGQPVNIDKLLVNFLSLGSLNDIEKSLHYSEFLYNIRNLPEDERISLIDFVKSTGWTSE